MTPARRAGFSLIEVLAALTITVLVVGAFSPFVAQLVHAWGRGARIAESADMFATASARIDRDLVGAVPMLITRDDRTTALFVGADRYLLFVSATGADSGRRGLELLSYAVAADGDAAVLVRRHGPLGTDPERPETLKDPVTLLSGSFRITLAYRPADGATVADWRDRGDLPRAVEVRITDRNGVAVLPAPLVFPITANYPAACIADDAPDVCSALGAAPEAGGEDGENVDAVDGAAQLRGRED